MTQKTNFTGNAVTILAGAIAKTRGNAIVLNATEFQALRYLVDKLYPPSPTESEIDQSVKLDPVTALRLILDSVDYTSGACNMTEMVGAVLPIEIIAIAKKSLESSNE